jgi:hypothetical protein
MPTDYEPPSQKTEQGKPDFAAVDNPRGCTQYVFRPEFGTTAPNNTNNTRGTVMPKDAQPVPINPEGKHIVGDWGFTIRGGRRMPIV